MTKTEFLNDLIYDMAGYLDTSGVDRLKNAVAYRLKGFQLTSDEGSYVVNGERYKVLNRSKQNSKVRVFKSKEAAEREIERMQGRYVNASNLRACRIYREE